MRQDMELRNTIGRPATAVRLLFTPSRTSLLGYHMTELPEGVSAVSVDVNPFGAEIVWNPALPDGAAAVLSLDVLGDSLLREHEVWWDKQGSVVAGGEGEGDSGRKELLIRARSVWELAQKVIDQKRLHCASIPEVVKSETRRFHEFFCELDLQTNPRLLGFSGISQGEVLRRHVLITEMMECLKRRVLQRLEATRTHPNQPAPDLEVWPDRSQIAAISRLQLDIFHKHLEQAPGVLDPTVVWQAFSLFANGMLRVNPKVKGAWDAAPIGSALFFFAEFAFMAWDEGFDRADWEAVLPALVGIQRVFTHAYCPREGTPESWGIEHYEQSNFREGGSMPDTEVEVVRQWFAAMSLDRLRIEAGLNAADAFPGSRKAP